MANIGQLNERLTFTSAGTELDNGFGEIIVTPGPLVECWCSALQIAQTETLSYGLDLAESNYKFVVRYEHGRLISTKTELSYKGRVFNVLSPPLNNEEDDRFMVLLASAREAAEPYISPGLWTGFTTLGDGWVANIDGSYTQTGSNSTSDLLSDLVLEAGEVYLINITSTGTDGPGGFLAFSANSFSDIIGDRVVFAGNEIKELTSTGGAVDMSIASQNTVTFKINSISKKVV